MPDDVVTLYEAMNEAEAGLLCDALGEEGVEATMQQTPSPFDGAGALGGTEVYVKSSDAARAKAILDRFLAEHAEPDFSDIGDDEE